MFNHGMASLGRHITIHTYIHQLINLNYFEKSLKFIAKLLTDEYAEKQG